MPLLLLTAIQFGCGENAPDCLQSAGSQVQVVFEVPAFTSITVFENIRLVLRQGPEREVLVATGEHLLPDISARVEGDVLELRDSNSCNLFREYGLTTIYVTTPELEGVRSSSGWTVQSEGVLAYEDLSLVVESFNNPETVTTDGAFDLELATGAVRLVANGIAYFHLTGETGLLSVNVAAGDSRVEASGLVADRINLNHRGTNDLLVYPVMRIEGVIRGYGDVLCYNRPPEIEVAEAYRGRLLFID